MATRNKCHLHIMNRAIGWTGFILIMTVYWIPFLCTRRKLQFFLPFFSWFRYFHKNPFSFFLSSPVPFSSLVSLFVKQTASLSSYHSFKYQTASPDPRIRSAADSSSRWSGAGNPFLELNLELRGRGNERSIPVPADQKQPQHQRRDRKERP